MMSDLLFAIDWSQVPTHVADALFSGDALIMNGVARKAGTMRTLKHMPFRPVPFDPAQFTTDLSGPAGQLQN